MGAQLAATVYVTDPDSHQQVRLEPGTCPEPRLAALVTAKGAWVDGKMPNLPKTETAQEKTDADTGDGPAGASGDNSEASDADNPQAAPAAKKTAATTRAASTPARGRDADE